tara:strand:+ start:171 stop:329 length:159 start_codon:yes stop_codon:yes gene_type:complete
MNERFEKVNRLLNIFCKDQLEEETLSDGWITNLKLLKSYSEELSGLVRDLNG